ncbi:TetR/AcrR family transcriptional regulator [Acinetobacter pseudolwoffii]|uniref:TetR/AcrR family transcriptional regulator n=1 Tax=Acinetobacter pseudolwoffii TaxID=2053287 RepID=UPI0025750288|nr:TetR/AcrR family transcriptional regulator [Acinetobacter pseudolwoffii]MDM1336638.1 TetR/AcrR family transcriptional regulator [Acinetobacter pseudolwoffii]
MQIPVGRPKDLEKRQRILSAAKALFLAHGYHASSMNQIAREAGVSKLTVYNHFQDKATLFSCAIEDTCEAILHEHPQVLQPSSDFAQEFHRACLRVLNIISLPEAIKLDLLLMELASQQSPLAEQFYQASHAKLEAVWHDFFVLAQHYQFIQVDRPEKQTELIVSLLTGTRHQKILLGLTAPPSSTEQQQIINQAIELFMLKYAIAD